MSFHPDTIVFYMFVTFGGPSSSTNFVVMINQSSFFALSTKLVMGMRVEGTLGACRYLANNLDSFPSPIANAEGIILRWYDLDGDGEANAEEMAIIVTYP